MATVPQIVEADGKRAGGLTIAVIGPNDRSRAELTSALAECHGGQIKEFVAYPSRLDDATQILAQSFDIVIVELDSDLEAALDLVESISVVGSAVVMVYSQHNNQSLLVRCMRAGAREFLMSPYTRADIEEAMVRASARHSTAPVLKKSDGSLFVFLGSKGGSGVTTLACNFAVSLAQESGKDTLLIDLNLPLGDAAINLGIKTQYSTVDALQNSNRLDPSFLSTLLVKHSSGLFVLAAPTELTPTHTSNEDVDRLLEVARQKFDYIVVDGGYRLDLQRTVLFNESTTIYLVTQVGVPELRNANRLIKQFSHQGGPRLEIVLNRYMPGSDKIDEEQVTKALTRPAKWTIPNNYAAVRKMQNTATPLALEDSSISRMIRKMATTACGKVDTAEKKKGFRLFR